MFFISRILKDPGPLNGEQKNTGGFRQIHEAYLLAQVHGLSNFKDLGPLNSKNSIQRVLDNKTYSVS